MSNLVVHFEIHAVEPQRLMDYYTGLLGWTFTRFGEMPYWAIDTGEGAIAVGAAGNGINGGLTQRMGPAPALDAPISGANIVVGIDGNVDELYRRGLDLGGTEALPPDDMLSIGRVAYLRDPEGNVFGMISPVLSDGTDVTSFIAS
ncbi:VOC family protein [Leifsonia sp. NPDC056665]|uniref:VOC family protein n=1 Tax=Leifsonia sp. NPDC056665 TaxID=3345901 RepID=UPI0036974110